MIYLGTNATFSVVATGSPRRSFQWRFNGNDLPGKINAGFTVVSAQFSADSRIDFFPIRIGP